MKYTTLITLSLIFGGFACSDDKADKFQKSVNFKEVSKSIPLEGQYLVISENAFFHEGKVLSKDLLLKSIKNANKIDDKPSIALHSIKGGSVEEFIAIRKELHESGYLVCSSAHAIDLNELYRRLAKANKMLR